MEQGRYTEMMMRRMWIRRPVQLLARYSVTYTTIQSPSTVLCVTALQGTQGNNPPRATAQVRPKRAPEE